MVKLSEVEDYLQYGTCVAYKDYQGALGALERCLAIPEVKEDSGAYALLIQFAGKVHFALGEKERAIECFNRSEEIDPSSLMTSYFYARFLAVTMEDFHAATQKCDAIIKRATDQPFPESDGDCSSEWYVQKASDLKAYCMEPASKRSTHTPWP